jgi:hypothetical protein
MKRNNPNHIPLLIFAFMVALVVAALYFYIEHMITASVEAAAKGRTDLTESQSNSAHDRDTIALYDRTKADWDRIASYAISSSDTVSFLESIEAIGPKSGSTVTIDSIDADSLDAVDPGTLGLARAKVTVTGTWASVIKSIELAEVAPYHSSIYALHVSAGSQSDTKDARKEASWTASFTLEATIIKR